MNKNYTISNLNSVSEFPDLNICQVTLNGRNFPSTRKTVENIRKFRNSGFTTKVVLHYDFIYLVSRYILFKPHVRQAIIEEIRRINDYCSLDNNVLGIVMHTDWSLKKDYYKSNDKVQFIRDNYNSSLWDTEYIVSIQDKLDDYSFLEKSLVLFAEDFWKAVKTINIKILLENTTKVGPTDQGSLDWILDFIVRTRTESVYGIVYDTEHDYAVTGNLLRNLDFITSKGISLLVHLNAIPSEVKSKSKKDRHSNTTLKECSCKTLSDYENYISYLEDNNIPWVREVKEETIKREIEQLWN